MNSKIRMIGTMAMVLAVLSTVGCHGSGGRRKEPALVGLDADDQAFLNSPADRQATVVDRHPLFYKPREYWDNSGDNRFVKAAAATFVGVPAGVVGEVRQIISGAPGTVVTSR